MSLCGDLELGAIESRKQIVLRTVRTQFEYTSYIIFLLLY
jgi:hypothetical protein